MYLHLILSMEKKDLFQQLLWEIIGTSKHTNLNYTKYNILQYLSFNEL